MKLQERQVARFLGAPAAAVGAALLYGPDGGLVRERARTLLGALVDDAADPFRVVELSAEALRADPVRLNDEASQLSLLGGRRVVRLRGVGDAQTEPLRRLFAERLPPAFVIVEADDLGPRSSLRLWAEQAECVVAIACYLDEDVGAVARQVLAQHGVGIKDEAVAWLSAHLGSDRGVTRSELEKLALYVGAGGTAGLSDAEASIGDSAALDLEDLTFAVAGGDLAQVEHRYTRLAADGTAAITILRALARHFGRLYWAFGLVQSGRSIEDAISALRPPPFFKLRGALAQQLARWSTDRTGSALERALARVLDAEIACKRSGTPTDLVCARAVLDVCRLALSLHPGAARAPRRG